MFAKTKPAWDSTYRPLGDDPALWDDNRIHNESVLRERSETDRGVELVPFIVWARFFGGVRIHDAEECSALNDEGYCPFDKPSDHKMVSWPMSIRLDSFSAGLVERHCPHGVGHPDPDSVAFLQDMTEQKSWGVHGCDGCCIDTIKQHFIAG
jgi:hypothetical protein